MNEVSYSSVARPNQPCACHCAGCAARVGGGNETIDIAWLSASDFDLVLDTSQNCTPGHQQSILVGDSEMVWVTWHIDDTFKRQSADGVATSRPGNLSISATETLTNLSSAFGVNCTATAIGNKISTRQFLVGGCLVGDVRGAQWRYWDPLDSFMDACLQTLRFPMARRRRSPFLGCLQHKPLLNNELWLRHTMESPGGPVAQYFGARSGAPL